MSKIEVRHFRPPVGGNRSWLLFPLVCIKLSEVHNQETHYISNSNENGKQSVMLLTTN